MQPSPSAAPAGAWMFQYNPRYFDLHDTLRKRQVEDWTGFWQRSYLRQGQIVYIFRSGKEAGIVAVGHLATPLYERPSKDRFARYWVDIAFDALVEPVLGRGDEIRRDPLLREYLPYTKGVFRTNILLPPEVASRTEELVRERLRPITGYAGPAADNTDLQQEAVQAETTAEGFDPSSILDARRRTMRAIVQRQGQPAFRAALLQAYEGRCAITGSDVTEVLEAAHIIPYLGPETNQPTNGLLLRADLHTLFDLGLIAIDPVTMTVLVAPRLAGTRYGSLAGTRLRVPEKRNLHPSLAALDQHRAWAHLETPKSDG